MKFLKSAFCFFMVCLFGFIFIAFMNSDFMGNVIYYHDEFARIITFSIIYLAGIITACTVYIIDELKKK